MRTALITYFHNVLASFAEKWILKLVKEHVLNENKRIEKNHT